MLKVFQFVSEPIVRMGHGISPSPCMDRTNLYKCLGLLRARGSWPLLSRRRASRSEGWMHFLRRRMHMCQSQWGLRTLQCLVDTCAMSNGWQIPRLTHLMMAFVVMLILTFHQPLLLMMMTLLWWTLENVSFVLHICTSVCAVYLWFVI